jgi:hypothetical protein
MRVFIATFGYGVVELLGYGHSASVSAWNRFRPKRPEFGRKDSCVCEEVWAYKREKRVQYFKWKYYTVLLHDYGYRIRMILI